MTKKQFRKHGGTGLLERYNGSVHEVLRNVFPEKQWTKWKIAKSEGRPFSKDQYLLFKHVQKVQNCNKISITRSIEDQ